MKSTEQILKGHDVTVDGRDYIAKDTVKKCMIEYAKEIIDHMVQMGSQWNNPEAVIYEDDGEPLWDYNAIDYLKKSLDAQIEE